MIELADIFRQYGDQYCAQFDKPIPRSHRQVMKAIITCRTEALGGHHYVCDRCEQSLFSYHSCKNRHCPKCQNEQAQQWLVEQQALLLPTHYFMITFTDRLSVCPFFLWFPLVFLFFNVFILNQVFLFQNFLSVEPYSLFTFFPLDYYGLLFLCFHLSYYNWLKWERCSKGYF